MTTRFTGVDSEGGGKPRGRRPWREARRPETRDRNEDGVVAGHGAEDAGGRAAVEFEGDDLGVPDGDAEDDDADAGLGAAGVVLEDAFE